MKRRFSTAAGVLALACSFMFPATSFAATEAVTASCDPGRFCWWQHQDFVGQGVSYSRVTPGACTGIGDQQYVRSYINHTPIQGWFYRSKDCSGEPGGVMLPNKQARDIGTWAFTFREGCVTCQR